MVRPISSPNVVSAGEVMVELAPTGVSGMYRRAYAGDSFNTAVYLARAGLDTRYLTRLGDDAGSEGALQLMRDEGVDTSLICRAPHSDMGLYLIDNDETGERTFTYYRDASPARHLFDAPHELTTDVFYFTGITLAVTRSGHTNLLTLLAALKDSGCRVVFDPNYRPRLWPSQVQAREACLAVLRYCDVVLPTQGDDLALWGHASADQSTGFYRNLGADEIVVKGEELEAAVWTAAGYASRQAERVPAVDTTGAGDAFNAGYLASRLRGGDLDASLEAGQRLAAEVVGHRGALIPRPEAEVPPEESTEVPTAGAA